jgi:hypothetical protein
MPRRAMCGAMLLNSSRMANSGLAATALKFPIRQGSTQIVPELIHPLLTGLLIR